MRTPKKQPGKASFEELEKQLLQHSDAITRAFDAMHRPVEPSDIALELHRFINNRSFNASPADIAEGLFIAMQLVGGVSNAARIAGQFSRESCA